jgi:tetratricopeptide (TPR) repeat protein
MTFALQHRYLNAVLVAAFLFSGSASFGHTAIDEQIKSVNLRIDETPADYTLYLRRANLQRLHGNWDASLADYTKAEKLGPDELPQDLDFYRGRVWFDAGDFKQARQALDRFLKLRPNHYEARLTSARTWVALGNVEAATKDFTSALKLSDHPSPDLYIERSAALSSAGKNAEALDGIREAVEKKGPLITLVQFAIELEESQQHYQEAQAWIAILPAAVRNQPRWLLRSGDLYAAEDEATTARTQWSASLNSLNALPPARQEVSANKKLSREIESRLQSAP